MPSEASSRLGLVVGKFSPLHAGHEELVRAARAGCDALLVVSWSLPEFPGCEAARRRRWLEWRFGALEGVRFEVLDPRDHPDMPDNDAPGEEQRAFIGRWLVARGARVDVVFTSEEYGDGFAASLARTLGRPVRHVSVDPARSRVPVSATAVRAGASFAIDPRVLEDYRSALDEGPSRESTASTAASKRAGPMPDTTT
jgi:HTH-type transcriptional repressor of NAD biosynthesis genes